jgi:hypothetical protein
MPQAAVSPPGRIANQSESPSSLLRFPQVLICRSGEATDSHDWVKVEISIQLLRICSHSWNDLEPLQIDLSWRRAAHIPELPRFIRLI